MISRQYEAGARVEVLGALASLAWFHIDRGLSYTDLSSGSPGTYVTNGRAVHQGVEASVQGRLTRTVSVSLAGQYLRAVQRETGSAAQDGKWVDNTPRWSGSAFVEYRPAALPALGVSAGLFYTGKRYADAQNLYVMPAYTTYSLGADYKLRLPQGRALTLRVNGDNITNTRYWATGGSVFYVGLARQVRFSASMDF
ncbi:TonB-dependent receptor domain-containing protein [Novosphingobium rhizosphaerae]|uniref:TonB-dependent receptor domain-containing protein n=1 Tax=Novosphingobium rhizosphaerae TaxID=1551649 RepID=UPI003D81914B